MKNHRKFAFGCIGLGLIALMAFVGKVSGQVAVEYITYTTLGVMGGYVGEYVFKGKGVLPKSKKKKGGK